MNRQDTMAGQSGGFESFMSWYDSRMNRDE